MTGYWCVGLILMRCFAVTGGGTVVECPPVRSWSPAFQKQVAAELRATPKGSAMARVVIDAIGDRDVARVCRVASPRNK
jgi:hypothetical protein